MALSVCVFVCVSIGHFQLCLTGLFPKITLVMQEYPKVPLSIAVEMFTGFLSPNASVIGIEEILSFTAMYRVGQNKPDCFSELITLRWLVVERRVVCEKFPNFILKKKL